MIDPGHKRLSIVRQCELVSISRASFYRPPASESPENLTLMRLIDEAFLECPFYGARQMARHLRRLGWCIGRKRVRRLMRKIGLSPIYQAPKTSEPASAAQNPSLPAAAYGDRAAEPGLVRRRDLHPDAARLPLPRRHHGPSTSSGGRAARSWLGGCRTRWRPTSASRHWRRPSLATAGLTSSIPTRAARADSNGRRNT